MFSVFGKEHIVCDGGRKQYTMFNRQTADGLQMDGAKRGDHLRRRGLSKWFWPHSLVDPPRMHCNIHIMVAGRIEWGQQWWWRRLKRTGHPSIHVYAYTRKHVQRTSTQIWPYSIYPVRQSFYVWYAHEYDKNNSVVAVMIWVVYMSILG